MARVVRRVLPLIAAIALLVSPRATPSSTSRSRGVSARSNAAAEGACGAAAAVSRFTTAGLKNVPPA